MDIKLVTPKAEDYHGVDKLLLHLHNKHAGDYPTIYNELDAFNNQEEYNEFIKQKCRIIILAKLSNQKKL